ncbi:DUF1553 domain-containing protein [Emticicia sp. BO119]|uniref:DUF1553 domain-containing protein n=1 Tax=Emticicia sp. BO119 TaxID=2757768 RepID=UPI0015F09BAF|nr:DUF1553 domain-containing protein [Emticicia sp. BO119]MBA4850002.1 DUF1553 domain-containing protein [Emticicia sp. BO119]
MRLSHISWILILSANLLLFSCKPDLPDEVSLAYDELPDKLDYNLHVKPILSDKCFVCHGPDKAKQKAGLRLDFAEFAYANLAENPDKVAIDPGSLKNSEVFYRILSTDKDYMMPTPDSHLKLNAKEKAILVKWIKDGAKYQKHWAFLKPEKKDLPDVDNKEWLKNPIDNFILAKLEEEKLKPSKEADKEILLRRVSLDLTGLPATIREIDAFLKDNSPDAYEKQIDRLLASPHYGEKMAVDWLDLARFADSHGYTVDRLRDMSPYRDWVINAFNRNMSYEQFIHQQLAGDLMPKPTRDMIIATAFNRNHQQNLEGGIIEEEFQTEYVVDRTNTFGDAFLGLSVGCAKCHDHKYDPISQKNYYELFSFFNNVKEAGQISWDGALPTPTLLLPTKEQEKVINFINNQIKKQESEVDKAKGSVNNDFENWIKTGTHLNLTKEKIPQAGLLAQYTFDDGTLKNVLNRKQAGTMKRESGADGDKAVFEKRDKGKAMVMDGDNYLDLNGVGVFRKSEPFTIGLWIYIPKDLKEGVIIHKSQAERLYNFRGFHLYLKNDRLEINMAHTAPSNAITRISKEPVPRESWIQLTITYDGSSKANGFRLYQNGRELLMETTMDQLTKDILLRASVQPGLQIGAWWRGFGFTHGKVDDIVVYDRVLTSFELKILANKTKWDNVLDLSNRTELKEYYLSAIAPDVFKARNDLKQLRIALADSMEKIKEIMVMQEMPKRKKAYILKRGNYDALGEEVFPGTPEFILKFPDNLPKNRYGLAQWLTHEDNPLTARVAVNRLWQNFFGVGLVKTTEDFGNQGELPSHPQLLDWLAVDFRESGWDIKKLNKMIVMSATYRQDSKSTKEQREKDPENRLLAHGPVFRMTAEMIRDNALVASGLITTQIGGPSIKPYQPEGLWQINSDNYKQDSGEAVYRRSLYIVAKRSVPNPTLSTFDATSRSFCVVRRQKTNTPLQALVTLNDPTFMEAAKVIGEQMCRTSNKQEAIIQAYRKLTGRKPSTKEVNLLLQLQQKEQIKFKNIPEKAKGWLNAGQYTVSLDLDQSLVAANTVVASTILNSDATLTKR